MTFRVVRPMKRPETSNPTYRRRIPKDVLAKARGMSLNVPVGEKVVQITITERTDTIKVSLGTSDPHEGKIRHANIDAYLEGFWQSLRSGPTSLTHKQTIALAGELYHTFVMALEDDPGSTEMWKKVKADNDDALDGRYRSARLMIPSDESVKYSIEMRFGGLVDA